MNLASLRGRLFVWFQYLLPQHGLSRLVLAATRVRARWFKNSTIRGFLKLYRVDLAEAAEARHSDAKRAIARHRASFIW